MIIAGPWRGRTLPQVERGNQTGPPPDRSSEKVPFFGARIPPSSHSTDLGRNLARKSPQQRQRKCARLIPSKGSIFGVSRNTYELMTQIPEYGSCGCRINPHLCPRTSAEIHTAGEREVRVFKGFRCRLSKLALRPPLATDGRSCEDYQEQVKPAGNSSLKPHFEVSNTPKSGLKRTPHEGITT